MTHNVGKVDRMVRIVAGVALIVFGFFAEGPLRWLGLIGVVPLVTAAVGFCPAYVLFGLNTSGCCGGGTCSPETSEAPKSGGCCGGGCHKD